MFNVKKAYNIRLFQPLDVQLNISHWPDEKKERKCAFRNPIHDLLAAT